jgi:hypothetical protein
VKNKESYDLSEAIKNTYRTEPLKTNLSLSVAEKVFAGKPAPPAFTDRLLPILFYILFVSGAGYSLYYLVSAAPAGLLILFLLFAAGYWWISMREIKFFNNRY